MKISLILAHPKLGSFNHAIAEAALEQLTANHHMTFFHDLYMEEFDPLLPALEIPKDGPVSDEVVKHCEEIAQADGLVIVHPNWWGQPPAILKGWVDRVIRPGVAYEFLDGDSGEGVPNGLLKAQTAVVLNTSNTGRERERTVFGDPLETIWKNCVFGLCNVPNFYRRTFGIVVTSTDAQRSEWLHEVRMIMSRFFPTATGAGAGDPARSQTSQLMI